MNNAPERRLAKLEGSGRRDGRLAIVCRDAGQTEAEAIAARYPDGLPRGSRLMVISWME